MSCKWERNIMQQLGQRGIKRVAARHGTQFSHFLFLTNRDGRQKIIKIFSTEYLMKTFIIFRWSKDKVLDGGECQNRGQDQVLMCRTWMWENLLPRKLKIDGNWRVILLRKQQTIKNVTANCEWKLIWIDKVMNMLNAKLINFSNSL